MDRKNINRGFKKLRVWQDAVSLYVLACKIFGNFPFELKKVAGNSIFILAIIRYHITAILAVHWVQFLAQYKRWIRP